MRSPTSRQTHSGASEIYRVWITQIFGTVDENYGSIHSEEIENNAGDI